MTEAGQIFALLRSASAAELAKRFNVIDEGLVQTPTPVQGTTEGTTVYPRGRGIGVGILPAGQGATAASALPGAVLVSGTDVDLPAPSLADTLASAGQGGTIRAAVSLGHIAPPRADLLRLLAEGLFSGRTRSDGAATARIIAEAGNLGQPVGLGLGETGLPADRSGLSVKVGLAWASEPAAMADPSLSDGTSTTLDGPAARAMARDATARAFGTAAGASAQAAALTAQVDDGWRASGSEARAATAEARNSVSGRTASAAQVAAFAEALISLIPSDGAGRSAPVASGVIFNAAMIPGWPFPTAFAKDGAEGINPKAMLHQLAAAIEGLSPEEAAAYMAKIGGGHAFLRNLRKLLKDLDLIEKDEVKGLLFAFLETISTIASGIQLAFRQMSESAALQEALVNGDDPDEGGRPGRRRLRL